MEFKTLKVHRRGRCYSFMFDVFNVLFVLFESIINCYPLGICKIMN